MSRVHGPSVVGVVDLCRPTACRPYHSFLSTISPLIWTVFLTARPTRIACTLQLTRTSGRTHTLPIVRTTHFPVALETCPSGTRSRIGECSGRGRSGRRCGGRYDPG